MKKTENRKRVKNHIQVGDKVKVIAGDEKGFLGNVLSIAKKKSNLLIDGIIPRMKYIKNKQEQEQEQQQESKKIEIPIAIHVSNVMLWDKETNQASRIGYKIINGKKKRYFKKSNSILF